MIKRFLMSATLCAMLFGLPFALSVVNTDIPGGSEYSTTYASEVSKYGIGGNGGAVQTFYSQVDDAVSEIYQKGYRVVEIIAGHGDYTIVYERVNLGK